MPSSFLPSFSLLVASFFPVPILASLNRSGRKYIVATPCMESTAVPAWKNQSRWRLFVSKKFRSGQGRSGPMPVPARRHLPAATTSQNALESQLLDDIPHETLTHAEAQDRKIARSYDRHPLEHSSKCLARYETRHQVTICLRLLAADFIGTPVRDHSKSVWEASTRSRSPREDTFRS